MDRPLDARTRRNRLARRLVLPVGGAIALPVLWFSLTGFIRPSVGRDEIRTGRVVRGPIEATITASGSVIPEYEHVVTSPIDTRVTRILETPGTEVAAGEPIVLLDAAEAQLALDTLEDQIALKRNERERAELDLAGRLSELKGQEQIKSLELKSLQYEAKRNREYFEMGLFSRDDVRRAENDAERARIEIEQVHQEMEHAQTALQAKLEGLSLELGMLAKKRNEAAHRLRLASASSDRPGVLTWVVQSEGAAVRRGDELARVADLSRFRVEATVSDVHAPKVKAGLPTIVRTGDTSLEGRVTKVRPTVENGIITFEVALDEPQHPSCATTCASRSTSSSPASRTPSASRGVSS